ncbi:MAG: phosphoribosyltransferase family protein [Planctomycetota bacterium]|jgi:phosphoribosylpyrophosphate synthetase
MKLWPYKILRRDDDQIKADLKSIMDHFAARDRSFDMVVFVPYAGKYLSEMFVQIYDSSCEVNFVTVRRASTVSQENLIKKLIFKKRWLSDTMRHIDVLWRLVKYMLRLDQKMVAETSVEFDVKGKDLLVIDDDLATGATLDIVKSTLIKHGASSVATASISNHFLPDRIKADYSVYQYVLLRTKNSRDYYAS